MVFKPVDDGSIESLTLHQGGGRMTAPKLISETSTQSRTETTEVVEVDPVVFERLTGDYKLNEQLTISIRVEEGKLLAQATGQNSFQLFPLSEVEYKAKVANIRMVFNPVDDGSIESLTLHQGGGITTAPKL